MTVRLPDRLPRSSRWLLLWTTVAGPTLYGCHSTWTAVDSALPGSQAPQLMVTSPSLGSTWTAGQPVTFSATVSDDLDAPTALLIAVTSDLQGVVDQPVPAADGTIEGTFTLDAGTHVLTTTATDLLGNVGTYETTVRVLASTFPTQPGVGVSPAAPVTGDALTAAILVDAVDPEGDALTYVWSWTQNGVDAAIDTPDVPGADVVRDDVWAVSVYATDGQTQSPVATRDVTIGNAIPDPSPVAISPIAPQPGDVLTCTHADAVDPEGATIVYTFAWTVDGVDAGVTTQTFSDTTVRGQIVTCSVLVDDGDVTPFVSPPVRIGNAAPSLTGVAISPTSGDRTATFTATPVGPSDPDNDSVSVAYLWTVNGVDAGTGQTLSGVFNRDDKLVVQATPSDGYLSGTAVASPWLTVSDAAPGSPRVGFTRSDLVPGVPASCVVTSEATDIDGDAVSYVWTWKVNGVATSAATSTGTTSTLPTADLATGDSLTCTATATDGTMTGGSSSGSLTLGAVASGDVAAADAHTIIVGTAASGQFGKAVDDVGDLDGDGLSELIVAAPRGDGGSKGAVFLYGSAQLSAGGTLSDTDADAAFYGHANSDYLGSARGAAGAGDMDGDGLGDFVVSAPYDDTTGTDAGQAYLFYGGGSWTWGDDVLSASDARFRGVTGDWLGARMAGGDLDGDGISDLAISAPYNDTGVDKGGLVAVYFGGDVRLSGSYDISDADAEVYGTESDSELGWSLSVMGDGNGDGYGDLGVGVFYADSAGADAGQAALISGDRLTGSSPVATVSWLLVNGTAAGDRVGYDVSGAGDVDGDGLEDALIGGYLNDDAGTDAGEVGLFYGRNGLNTTRNETDADVLFEGEAAGDYFGGMVDGAGDWDGDGLDDLLLAAPHGSGGGVGSAGVGYLFLGADAGSWGATESAASASVRFLGTTSSDYLSDEGAGHLDVNGDGYADVALGAQGSDVVASGGGAVYVFEGP